MKLYVDDLRACPDGWTLARTVTEAIRLLDTQRVTHVSLDHDISHAVELRGIARPYPCGETFEPVARFIAALECGRVDGSPRSVTIHTANPAGAYKMRCILESAGIEVVVQLGRPVNGLEPA